MESKNHVPITLHVLSRKQAREAGVLSVAAASRQGGVVTVGAGSSAVGAGASVAGAVAATAGVSAVGAGASVAGAAAVAAAGGATASGAVAAGAAAGVAIAGAATVAFGPGLRSTSKHSVKPQYQADQKKSQ